MAEDGRRAGELRSEPELDAGERAALEAALARLGGDDATPGRSAWWRAGVRENVAQGAGERSPHPAGR